MAEYVSATVTIRGTASLSQSHQHAEPYLEGESHDAYDERTWPHKMNRETMEDGREVMIIPSMALQRSIVEGARFSKKKIQGEGKSTWAKRFEMGVSVISNGRVYRDSAPVEPKDVGRVVLSLNSDGKRGSGSRVIKRLPQIPPGWTATFEILILDPWITRDIFEEMLENAGLFCGVGQFRPEKGGSNGRFVIEHIDWRDNRQPVARRKAA